MSDKNIFTIMLENKFYKIINISNDSEFHVFEVELLQDCDVYEGHFPGEAIAPGVCNIQMIKECAEKVVGHKLLMYNLQQVRLTTLVKPDVHNHCEVRLQLQPSSDEEYKLRATIGSGDDIYLDLKAELSR